MQSETLFDSQVSPPTARATDPKTAHLAAVAVTEGVSELETAILQASWELYIPSTPFELANRVRRNHGERWCDGTIRTRISQVWKAGDLVQDGEGKSPRGVGCVKLRIPSPSYRWERVEDVPTNGAL